MLCPEVWQFKEPAHNFKQEFGNFDKENCSGVINSLSCNHLVTAVLPDTLKVPEEIVNVLLVDTEYYKVEEISIDELVTLKFLKNFVNKGKLTALSLNSRIDCEDCVLITPEGVLVLSLTKDTYQRLGVEGKVSHFHKKTKARYITKIDLNRIKPSKSYERLKERLSLIKATFIIKWEPSENHVCPSSIAKYLHEHGFLVKEFSNEHVGRTEFSVKIPNIDFSDSTEINENNELLEWLGALTLGCDLENGSPDNFLNTYQTPEPNTVFGQVKILQWRGFFSSAEINSFFDVLRKYVQDEHKLWAAFYVQGFSDCPLSWKGLEHHYFTNGDNGYVIVLNDNKCLLCVQTCSNKQYK